MNMQLHQPLQVDLAKAENVTHAHLFTVVNTWVQASNRTQIRLLDVGCGDGRLLSYLARCLPVLNPGVSFEFAGFDVADGGVQETDFFAGTIERLSREAPWIDWPNRIRLITSTDDWPMDGFDVIISNQVLEHVADLSHFMGQLHRSLNEGGASFHLFPLRECLWEGHLHLPLVHRLRQYDTLKSAIRTLSRLGLGIYQRIRRDGVDLETFVERHADFVQFSTSYRSGSEVLGIAKGARLRADFRYTFGFYSARLRRVFNRRPELVYHKRPAIVQWLALLLCKRVSSVTLCLEKRNTYR